MCDKMACKLITWHDAAWKRVRWKLGARRSAKKLDCLALNQEFGTILPKQERDKALKRSGEELL